MSINIKGKTNIGPIPEEPSIYYGGNFSYYNPVVNKLVSVLNSGGTVNDTFNIGSSFWHPGISIWINKVKLQQNNKILVGGRIYLYNLTTTNSLARLNMDGTLNSSLITGSGFNGDVLDMQIQPDEKIIVSGFFTSYNASSKNRIVRIDSGGTIDSSFVIGTGFNQAVYTLNIQADGKILAGGDFTTYSGASKNRLIRLNIDGSIDDTFNIGSGFNSVVRSTTIQPDGKILVGGDFTTYSGVSKNKLIRLNTDGTIDNTFNATLSTSNGVYSLLVQPDNKILVAGYTLNGSANTVIIRLNVDGSIDDTFNTGSGFLNTVGSIYINSVQLQNDGKIVAVGSFSSCNGYDYNNIIRLNSDGSVDTSFDVGTGTNSQITSVTLTMDNNIIIGGYFSLYNQIKNAFNIVKTNPNGVIDSHFNFGSGFNSTINCITRQNDRKLLIGGSFTSYNGIDSNYIIRLNPNGTIDETFSIPVEINSSVNTIELQNDGKILLGGYFTKYIIRLNTDGTVDNTFNVGTGFNGQLSIYGGLKLQPDGKILAIGFFTSYSGVSVNRIVRLNTDGSVDNTFNVGTGFNNIPQGMDLQSDNKIIVVGGFISYNGISKNRIIRLNTDGSVDNTFNVGTGFNITAVVCKFLKNGKILVTGPFATYNGISRISTVRINSDGSLDTGYPTVDPGLGAATNAYPRVISEDLQGRVLLGGNFERINTVVSNRVVRLTPNGLIDNSFNSGTGLFIDYGNAIVSSILLVKV